MEEHPRPWSNQELSLPNPSDQRDQVLPPRDAYAEQKQVSGQELSESNFAERAVEDVLKQNPEAALRHTIEAAKRDEPIEMDRELRAEVRDRQSDMTQGAIPVGQVIAGAANRQPGVQPVTPPPVEPPLPQSFARPQSEPPLASPVQTSLYRRAMLAGFITAIFIIIGYILYRFI